MGLLESRSVVVTDAAQGGGPAIARASVDQAASVVTGDLDAARAESAAARRGRRVATSPPKPRSRPWSAPVLARHGSLDIMVNNAGMNRDATLRRRSVKDFGAEIDVHLFGARLGTRFAAAVMGERGRGRSSTCRRFRARSATPGRTDYRAATAGIGR